jgi:endonuclease III related protein
MPTLAEAFEAMHSALVATFGRARSEFEDLDRFEAMLAVLLSRTLGESSWRAALDGLREAELLTPERLAEAGVIEIGDAVSQKGRPISAETLAPLRHLARWLVEHQGGQVDALFDPDRSTDWLRDELAAIKGVGIKGADALLLLALKRPSYPVDRATFRVLVRHDWLDPSTSYEEARDLLVDQVRRDVEDPAVVLTGLAHGMELLGKRFCRPSAPRCEGCPLEALLPEGGPRGAED